MAQQWRDKKRLKRKIGSYPAVSLASAREIFGRDFAAAIQKRKIATDTRSETVADLFEGYIASLKAAGKSSWKEAEKGLNEIGNTLGHTRPAREIDSEEIVEVIRLIYEDGARAMADHVRSYIRSAYSWGMKSEHDCRATSPRRFHIPYNPASGIPTEPKVRGTRWHQAGRTSMPVCSDRPRGSGSTGNWWFLPRSRPCTLGASRNGPPIRSIGHSLPWPILRSREPRRSIA